MKPNFALNLSNDGAELLHRGASGWLVLGAVHFENDDVQAGCARLLAEAEKLEPGNVRTKLVLPESQLRYSTVLAPGPTDEARRYQIEAEIEALTPYSIDELVYDFAVEDDHALIVICASETLAEAEHFAEDAGFNPVAFVAAPQPGLFSGEPNFGETSVAPAYLAGERVQFDSEPVRVSADAAKGAAKTAAPAEPPSPAARASAARAKAPAAASIPKAPDASRPAAQPTPIPPAEPLAKVGNLVRRMGTRLRREQAASGATAAATSAARSPVSPEAPLAGSPANVPPANVPPASVPPASVPPTAVGATPPRPAAAQVPRSPAQVTPARNASAAGVSVPVVSAPPSPVAPVRSSAAMPRAPETPAPEAHSSDGASPVAFSSRRRAAPVIAASGTGSAAANPGGRIAVLPGDSTKQGPSLAARLQARARAASRSVWGRIAAARTTPNQTPSQSPAQSPGLEAPQPTPPDATPNRAKAWVAPGLALGGERRRDAAPAEPIVAASRPPASEREKASEAEALTIFGARGNTRSNSGLAGTLLMAGGGVVLLLVCVAAWFLYFSGPSEGPINLAGDPAGGIETPLPAAGDGAGAIEAPTAVTGLTQDPDPALPDTTAPVEAASVAGQNDDPARDPLAQAVATAVQEATGAAADATQGGGANPVPDAAAAADQVSNAVETAAQDAVQDAASDAASTAGQAAETGVAEIPADADPNSLLESLVAEALNETLPTEALDLTGQGSAAADQPLAPSAQASVTAPATDTGTVITQSAPASVNDTPQLAAVSTTSPMRMSLPSSITVPEAGETTFETPPPPPPFGAEFTFDANGLVEATPEGALTPSGVVVFAGRPVVAPAVRPAGLAPEAVAPPPVAEVLDPEAPRADPALAQFRPLPRSDRVRQIGESQTPQPAVPDATQQQGSADTADPQQDAALDQQETQTAALEAPPPGGVSLDALRPQRRPTDLVPPEVIAAAEAADAIAADPDATPEAVAISLRPSARPSDVTERARAILAAAGSGRQAEDQASETAVAAAQPEIPSSASVARQATQTNAISLNEINLIGVFGAPENRRALVRLSSGRRVRVGVGDRLNGGQVTAIDENQLHYTRRGRNEVLSIGG